MGHCFPGEVLLHLNKFSDYNQRIDRTALEHLRRLAMQRPLVEQVRSFNRIVTERVGALNDHFLGRDHPLGEARLLWEIGVGGAEIRELRSRLGLDSAYVSRLLRS